MENDVISRLNLHANQILRDQPYDAAERSEIAKLLKEAAEALIALRVQGSGEAEHGSYRAW